MLRQIVLGLILYAVLSSPALAQAGAHAQPASPTESRSQSVQDAGRAAARQYGVGGYFISSFLGGLPAGFLLPIGGATGEPTSLVLGGAGATVVIVTTSRAYKDEALPPLLNEKLQAHTPEYRDAFHAAYSEQLSRRRVRASLWGGGIGAGVGFGTLVWLLSQIGDF